MFEITVVQDFAAAHKLKKYQGQCSALHGHTWKVELTISGHELDEMGLLIDFREVKKAMLEFLGNYDHGYLNEIPPFDQINPSAENLAKTIFDSMKIYFPKHQIKKVKVWESANSYSVYREG